MHSNKIDKDNVYHPLTRNIFEDHVEVLALGELPPNLIS